MIENVPDVGNKLILEDVHARDEEEKTPLHHAAAENDHARAARLIKRGANVHAIGYDEKTPLHVAAEFDSIEVAALLIKYSANDVSILLYYATCEDAVGTATLLIKHGAGADMDDSLFNAIECKVLGCATLMIKHGANVNAIDKSGETLLHFVAKPFLLNIPLHWHWRDHMHYEEEYTKSTEYAIDAVTLLIKHGADIDVACNMGRTPLYVAVHANMSATAKLLIERGANVNAIDKDGDTPLHFAVYMVLSDNLIVNDKMYANVIEDPINVATLLIKHGADINVANHKGTTPLHVAAHANMYKIAKLLIEHGANVNAINKSGETPLHFVAKPSPLDIPLHWREHNNDEGMYTNAIEYATATTTLLIKHGADIDVANHKGETPLHVAVRFGFDTLAIVKLLIEHGANVNTINKSGETPLEVAKDPFELGIRNKSLIELLIQHSAHE